jgi:hypothetical protein
MSRVVFLLEEYSAKILLEGLLPRFFPDLSFLCIPHEGKQDLEKSFPRKLRAWLPRSLSKTSCRREARRAGIRFRR